MYSNYEKSMEKKIEKFVNNYESILYSQKWASLDKYEKVIDACKRGDLSILKAVYGLDVDNNSNLWCFRSENKDANSDYEEFELGNTNENIEDSIKNMMINIGNAVNNAKGFEQYKSYSKFIAVPLFKYYHNSEFIITKLPINSFNIEMTLNCFDWCGENNISWDMHGNEHDRYHIEDLEFSLPMKSISSIETMYKEMWNNLNGYLNVVYTTDDDGSIDYFMDIDDVDFRINGFTMDISSIGRSDFDVYYAKEFLYGHKFKRLASYRKDREIISTEYGYPSWRIQNESIIQLLRFIYILRISGLSKNFDGVVKGILNDRYLNIMSLNSEEKEILKWFSDYLRGDTLEKEIETYKDIFNSYQDCYTKNYPKQYWEYWTEDKGVKCLLDKMQKTHFYDFELLSWMRQKAGI